MTSLREYFATTRDPLVLEQAIELEIQDAENFRARKDYQSATTAMQRAFQMQRRLTVLAREARQ